MMDRPRLCCLPGRCVKMWRSNWMWYCLECGGEWEAGLHETGAVGMTTLLEYLRDLQSGRLPKP
jgi:hypothetical protein